VFQEGFFVADKAFKPLSRYWLIIGVMALAIAGLFSLVLVIARTPALSELPGFASLFHQALVVHVDLSVLLWFLSIACLLWSMAASPSRRVFPYLEESALMSFAAGMVAIAVSPLDRGAVPLMSNYIPVLVSPVFFLGLGLVLTGVVLMLVRFFAVSAWHRDFDFTLVYSLFAGALIALMACAAFVWSYVQMPSGRAPQEHFELLFWGGGHVLQFLHVQMLLVCWLMLGRALKPGLRFNRWVLKAITSVGLAVALLTPLTYLLYRVDSGEQRYFFTQAMIVAGGAAPAVMALLLVPVLWGARGLRRSPQRALWSCLLMSVLLFLYGGWLGNLIREQNVVIPAHYHGSIVGVTLGFMGVAYLLLPRLGYRDVSGWRMSYWQPIVYGAGQLLHITGLAWSGGYGVLRKTPGGTANLPFDVKAALGLMGAGGLIAIIGGFMFVIVMGKVLLRKEPAN
jgi:hypothetical protein